METTYADHSDLIEKERIVPESSQKKMTLSIAGAAIFGALSVGFSMLTTSIIPRLAWGIAIIDPVSIIWITSFLIFGFWGGILTVGIGTLGLLPFDPWTPWGPLMKFCATIWFVIIPFLYSKIKNRRNLELQDTMNGQFYAQSSLIAWIIRVFVMIELNYAIFIFLYGGYSTVLEQNMGWLFGLDAITGDLALILTVFLLNTIQTLFDVIIPYVIVKYTEIHKKFNLI